MRKLVEEQDIYPIEFIYDKYNDSTDEADSNLIGNINVKATSEEEAINKAKDYINSNDYQNTHSSDYDHRHFKIGSTQYSNVDLVDTDTEDEFTLEESSWQDKYDDFEDFEYEVTSTIESDLEYDPIPSEIEVEDFISNLGISMETEQSITDISVVESEYYVNDVTFDEDGDPDVATVGFQIRYHIKTKDRASAQEIAYAFDDIPINLLEYGLSGHYYTRGTIEIDEWSVTEMGKGKNAVSLYIQGGMDLNVYEFM